MVPAVILALQASGTLNLAEIVQTLTAAGVAGLIAFAFSFNQRMTRLETVLLEPDMGIVPRVKGIAKQGHDHASDLQGHALQIEQLTRRADDHDESITFLRDRPLQPTDVGKPDRRS